MVTKTKRTQKVLPGKTRSNKAVDHGVQSKTNLQPPSHTSSLDLKVDNANSNVSSTKTAVDPLPPIVPAPKTGNSTVHTSGQSSGSSGGPLQILMDAKAYFYEQLTNAISRVKVRVQPETEMYLVHLLQRFMNTENLFAKNADGTLTEQPLALQLLDALEENNPNARKMQFRQIGDSSLYFAGYFQDSLSRKNVGVDYYIDLGGNAYSKVAMLSNQDPKRPVFQELAEKFQKLVDVFAVVSDQTTPKTEQNLLRIYEMWEKTGSERAARQLEKAGITPQQVSGHGHKKTIQ